MASLEGGEKQLFEKFWQGTFKAVATPRPGSVIVASITSRKPLASTETPSCLSLSASEKLSGEPHPAQEIANANGCVRLKDSKEHPRHKSRSPPGNEDFSPPPTKGKKKKKKSTRKKRRRSPSYSLSPLKKKKKKKNSKKRKRSRLSSKKRRHSSSSPKSKRKEEKKHKKHSHSHSQKSHRPHHRHCRSDSESTNSRSESCGSRPRTGSHEEGHKARWKHARHSSKSARKPDGALEVTATTPSLQNRRSLSATEMISKTGVSTDLFKKAEGQLGKLAKRNGEPHEYDSGNDTSSPPSTQTSASKSKGREDESYQAPDGLGPTFSPGKASSGSSSDSGNSFTSCFSRTKGAALEEPTPAPWMQEKAQREVPLQSEKKKTSLVSAPFSGSPLIPCLQNGSSSSRSSLESDRSHLVHHKASPRSSQSRSCSSDTRSYSRSPSYSPKSYKRSPKSRSSRPRRSPSYSRYSPPGRDREQDDKYSSVGKESHRHHSRRRRKPSYSPLRKRRRDSPSHLEARRITSARKRPIPYYRPSPSSSSPSSVSSYSSWYSCLSHSPSRSYSNSRSSRSRSRSWSSSSSSRSHSSGARNSRRSCSRSSESTGSYDSMRR
ncbi:serine/arginine repetitive matrix protein 4 [Sceloporus undulatus]|uniref:serine/arginine repetitive matrix protein 4 n=1 Tax=Sceloporus undulatus TaxID=8520 RepID=UPI001C4BDC55|nr:serine/arginine repetitive matrix protein 4 [Sceloporus undulatus]